jgi:hypothetical protein
MFLIVHDNTGDYNDVINSDMPDVVMDSLHVFDHFITHLRFEGDKIYTILRSAFHVGDYQWRKGMNAHSGPDDPFVKQVRWDHIPSLSVERMLKHNILLDRAICYEPDSPFSQVDTPPGKYINLRIWLIYPLMIIQEFPSYTASSNKVVEAVLNNITLVADDDKKFQYGTQNYNITMIPSLICSRIKYNIVRNIIISEYPLGNGHSTNEKTFDDIVKSLMEYDYALLLNGLHFIIHQQSPLLIIQLVNPICRSTL